MPRVQFSRTVSFDGSLYRQGSTAQISDATAGALAGKYVEVGPSLDEDDAGGEVSTTHIPRPPKSTDMKSPKPRKQKAPKKKSAKSSDEDDAGGEPQA